MIQIWCKIDAGDVLTEEEYKLICSIHADQYKKIGVAHDGIELLHCIITHDHFQQVKDFLTARGQNPVVLKAFDEDHTPILEDEIDSETAQDLFDSFFPLVSKLNSEGVPITKLEYDENGDPTGLIINVYIKTSEHSFWGWHKSDYIPPIIEEV